MQEVPATVFLCKNHKKALEEMEINGLVTLVDPTLTGLVTAEVTAAATSYGREYGQAIFQAEKKGPNGEYLRDKDDEGRFLMTYGEGGQRWMASFERIQPTPMSNGTTKDQYDRDMASFQSKEPLHSVLEVVFKRATELVRVAIGSEGYKVHKTVVMVNHPGKEGDEPVGMQAIHIDLLPFRKGFVGFLGLSRYSVLVSPMSHHAIRTFETLRKKNPLLEDLDLLHLVSAPKLVRLMIEPGQIVLVHGNTVHAGDAGSLGDWAPAFYATRGAIDNETSPIEHVHPLFVKLFL